MLGIYVGHSGISSSHIWEAEAGVYYGKFNVSLRFIAGLDQLIRPCLKNVKQTKTKNIAKNE